MLLHKEIFPFHISEVAPSLFLSCFIFLKTDSIYNMYLLAYLFGTLEQKFDERKTFIAVSLEPVALPGIQST